MNTTANADAMTAILRQISLDWNRTINGRYSHLLRVRSRCYMPDGGHRVHHSTALREPSSAGRPPAS